MLIHLTMTNLFLLSLCVFTDIPALFSIRFDEYYDSDGLPREGLDEYPCFQIGVKCKVSQECCGVACCVLPAWSPSPVCLVPGYKEDLRLVKMFGKEAPNMDDILFSHQQYNTTFFDSILMNFTSLSPQVIGETTAKTIVVSKGDENSTAEMALHNNESSEISNQIKTEGFTSINKSAINTDSAIAFQDSLIHNISSDSQKNEPEIFGQNLFELNNISDLPKSLELLKKSIMNHHSFLLLNSSLENAAKTDLADEYEQFKSSAQLKTVVKELQEKIKLLNEQERKLGLNFTAMEFFSSMTTTFATTQTPSTKESKWDVVRKFFNRRSNMDKLNIYNNLSRNIFVLTTPKLNLTEHQNVKIAKYKEIARTTEDSDNVEGLEGIMKEIFKDSEEIINSENVKDNDEDILEVFNINIPYEEQNNAGSPANKNLLDNALSTLTNTIDTLKLKDRTKSVTENSVVTSTNNPAATANMSKQAANMIKTTTNCTGIQNKTKKAHLWSNIYLWPVNGNVSHKFTTNIKSLFHWKRKTNSSNETHERKQILLNERFLLTLNSKNNSKKGFLKDSSLESNTEKIISDYPLAYSSSMESASSYTEDLYNNSIVFVMHKRNSSDSRNNSTWDSLTNFFHISGVIPCPKNRNPCIDPLTGTCSSVENGETIGNPIESKDTNSQESVHNIIRLPESLMPEELEKRVENDTDVLFFEDAKEIEDKTIEEQSSANGTFFFFFK